MSAPKLFQPFDVGGLALDNRIVIAPMCQYSAVDGAMNDWHLIHLGQLALSGAALLTIEATAVLPEGRISHADVGLWDDATQAAMQRVLDGVRRYGSAFGGDPIASCSAALVSAVEAVLPILEQAVAAVSQAQEYPYELDVILRSDTPSTAQRCLSAPSRLIH
jgi:2,4-dienoyl-CoA reductase-like NADH-dependent reductase (Old Yellow Enzyme family)